MPEFCREFNYTNEEHAHEAFTKLLSTSILPKNIEGTVRAKLGTLWKEAGTLQEIGSDYVVQTFLRHQLDRNDEDVALQSSQNPKQSRIVTTPEGSSSKGGQISENLQSSIGSSSVSTDKDDTSYCTDQDFRESTSKIYTWNYLDGRGRHDSNVESAWMYKNAKIGCDLLDFRQRVVQENGGLTEPHEKLAVNFIFLVESGHQTGELQAEIEDESWSALCEATKDRTPSLPDATVVEAHRWAHLLANEDSANFNSLLEESAPKDPALRAILGKLASSGQLWSDNGWNEDTYLKSWLGPFLETYLGKIKFVTSSWTLPQDETRGQHSDLLVPDYSTTTVANKRQMSPGMTRHKLGQEVKLALDSILALLPEDDVEVIGILVREPLVEFYAMAVRSEATYVMRRFAVCNCPADQMNMFPVVHMMEAFQQLQAKVERTVAAIRRVKVRTGTTPKVPLTWLRPSFSKPRRSLVIDGE
ncbi:hypothetical protein BGZ94_002465 [Podila epigama]|nr:hypothetical protein BGZ94_002465 [Podila epigama]